MLTTNDLRPGDCFRTLGASVPGGGYPTFYRPAHLICPATPRTWVNTFDVSLYGGYVELLEHYTRAPQPTPLIRSLILPGECFSYLESPRFPPDVRLVVSETMPDDLPKTAWVYSMSALGSAYVRRVPHYRDNPNYWVGVPNNWVGTIVKPPGRPNPRLCPADLISRGKERAMNNVCDEFARAAGRKAGETAQKLYERGRELFLADFFKTQPDKIDGLTPDECLAGFVARQRERPHSPLTPRQLDVARALWTTQLRAKR